VQRHVDDLVEEMLAEPQPDAKVHIANKLPVRVIVDLIGVPQSDRDLIWEWSEAVGRLFSLDETSLREADEAIDAFRAYVGETVARVRATGEGPELAKLMLDSREDEVMTEDELVAMYLLILFGGSETTTNLLGNGFLALQRHRDQWDLLISQPGLMAGAVNELMRYDSPHHYLPRVAAADFDLHGTPVRAGQTVIIMMGAANRDETVFGDPDRLDITRPNSNAHLSFAIGAHYCLGAALARLEGRIALDEVLSRFPEWEIDESGSRRAPTSTVRGWDSMPAFVA